MKPLTPYQIGYLAGILDGEGCIRITEIYDKKRDYYGYGCRIHITNTNLKVLEFIKNYTELGKIHLEKQSKFEQYKAVYVWYISHRKDIKEFLNIIIEHLIIKKEKANLMLEFVNLLENRNFIDRKLILDERIERECIYKEMKELNKKGD